MKVIGIVFGMLLAGCATKPKTYKAPDSAPLVQSGQRLASAVAQSHVTASRARVALKAVEETSARVGQKIDALPPKLDELLRISPVELRPVIEGIQVDVTELQAEQTKATVQIAETHRAQSALADALEQANAAKNEHLQEQAVYIAKADDIAQTATTERAARSKAETALNWYRVRWWGSWLALGAGVIGCGVFALLKTTGRLAMKLP